MYYYSYYKVTFTLKVTNSKRKTLSFTTKENKMKYEIEKFEEKLCRYREPCDSSFSSFQTTSHFPQKFANQWFFFQFSLSYSTKKAFF